MGRYFSLNYRRTHYFICKMCAKRLEFIKNRVKLRPMKKLSVMFLLLMTGQAHAGNLYRCVGSDGIPNYTSKKVTGASCVVVAKTKPEPSPAPQPQALSAAAAPAASPAASASAAEAQGTVNANTAPAAPAAATELKAPPSAQPASTASASSKAAASSAPKFLRMGRSTTYSYVDANGIKNFSSRKPKGVSNIVASTIEYPIFSQPNCYACGLNSNINFKVTGLNTTAYAAEIKAASAAYGVEEAVVRAIIHAESAYRPHVQSHAGAQGLMQLIPATARRFGVSDSFDPGQNINGGVQYLAWLLKRYGQDLTLASAAYNAGEGAVDRHGGVPPYRETQNYVVRVGQLAERYRKVL
jgi:soluble lytic murein transglycosylase-like protein